MIQIDESTITLITTIASVVMGIFAKYKHDQYSAGQNILGVITKKAELGALLLKKVKDANADSTLTPDEFTGIVNTAEELVNLKN